MSTLYEVLGVTAIASEAEIKTAYRRMSRLYHPDLAGPGGAAMMGRANQAYDSLKSPELRAAYDESLTSTREPLAEEPDAEPESWGTEDVNWVENLPGARHLAEPGPVPESTSEPRPPRRLTCAHWVVAGVCALLLLSLVAMLLNQWQANAVAAGSWNLLMRPVLIAAVIQLFKREFGFKLQALLVLGMLLPLGMTGIWILSPWWNAVGPLTGTGLALLGPLVWTIRAALSK